MDDTQHNPACSQPAPCRIMPKQVKRVPGSPQLRLYYQDTYQGMPVMQKPEYGGLVENYLARCKEVIRAAHAEYPRLFAVRVDLRFPGWFDQPEVYRDNACLKRFFHRLQWELDTAGMKYSTCLHYLWAREQASSDRPHYHLILMVNHDAIRSLGIYHSSSEGDYDRSNLYHRIARAWAYALSILHNASFQGLVHVAKDPWTHKATELRILPSDDGRALQQLFYCASYLCKFYSKRFGEGANCFGSSRR